MQRECENAESRVQRESENAESRGGSTVHYESTVREYRVESAESQSAESARIQSRECRDVSAEIVSTVREHSGKSTESREQRVQGHRVERREHSAR